MASHVNSAGALPWTVERPDRLRFGFILFGLGLLFLVPAVWIPYVQLPEPDRSEVEELPPQLARLMEQRAVPEPEKLLPVEPEREPEPEPEISDTEVTPEPTPVPEATPKVVEERVSERPTQTIQEAREVASRSGLLALQGQLAQMRQPEPVVPQRLTANVAEPGSDVVVAASQPADVALAGSGGIAVESGPQHSVELSEHEVREVEVAEVATPAIPAVPAPSAQPSRSMSNIRSGFDAQKTALYALYRRQLRQDPTLEGTVVLKLTIEPDGRVSSCEVESSELGNPELEARLASRVLLFNFGADDVEKRTVSFPVEFLPS